MTAKKPDAETVQKELSYIGKVWHTVAIAAMFVIAVLVIRVAFNVLLMALAGALIAVYFHGLGDIVQRRTRLGRSWCMAIAVISSLIILVGLFWFMGTKIQSQVVELTNKLPATLNHVKAKLAETPIGNQVLGSVSGDNSAKLTAAAQSLFSTGFGVLGDMYIIIFLGIFFTANPSLYKDGILILIPPNKKQLGRHIMTRISLSLKGWLKGLLLSIVLITILLTIGLSIVGVPVALALALITGVLQLLANIGSVLAMIPGVLLAFTMGTNTAIIVALIYIVSQTIVGNIVLPLIQKRMINLPPALTLISQLIMGALSGALGIILAVPILAIIIILVDELYVKKMENAAEGLQKEMIPA